MYPRTRRPARSVVALAVGTLALTGAAAVPTTSAAAASSLHTVTVTVPAQFRTAPFDVERRLTVPAGWTAKVWSRVGGARMAAWAPDRSLLVSGSGRVVRLQQGTKAAAVPVQTVLLSGLNDPQGLAFDGTTLYVGESDRVEAFTYSAGVLSGRRTVISGLPGGGHDAKGLVVGADHALYVTVGSAGNTTVEDRTATPERAAIYRVDPASGASTVWAHGVRNGTGLALDPKGAIWTAVNNRDQIGYPWHRDYDGDGTDDYGKVLQGYVNDHPVEEIARLTSGRDLGWPYCNPDPDVTPGVAGTAFDFTKPPYVADVQLNPGGTKLNCATLPPIQLGLPAHSAPLGFHFVTGSSLPSAWRTGAVVAVHGSWNRQPPQPPSVQFLTWDGKVLAGSRTMVTGFQAADGSRFGRTVDAVPGRDGALYVTDDQSGTVYRLAPA
ncbi:PQQ-dependent sugar dehydrogenase [Jatrophihabitans sp. YIM 134969]